MSKKIYIIFSFFVPLISLFASYPWPLKPDTVQHPVTGTLGEYRTGHLHEGVDIDGSIGTNVYTVVDGTVTDVVIPSNPENEYVEVTGNDGNIYQYFHIDALVKKNDPVVAGETILGTIKEIDDPHLHFEVNDGMVNPLNGSGLTPYADTARTVVWGGDDFSFYRDGSNDELFSDLWGKVDILVRAKDRQKPGSENVGVYRIGYQVNNMEGDTVLPYTENIKFDNALGKVNYIYDKNQSNNSVYYYFVTNALGNENYQRCWNTKLQKGENWDGKDALINKDAAYPDGKYKVWVLAYDIKGNGGNMESQKGAAYEEVDVDNYVPFADEVTVKKDEEIKYNGKWELNGSEMELDIPTDDSVSMGDKIKLTISFSEVMSSTINVKIKKETNEVKVDGSWNEGNLIWEGNVTIPDEEESKGEWTIMTPHTANGLRLTAKV
jgi:murein DD-endopeptidase MepM/ murein hydrolase activator NlpD